MKSNKTSPIAIKSFINLKSTRLITLPTTATDENALVTIKSKTIATVIDKVQSI
jgi:hypothetical protein